MRPPVAWPCWVVACIAFPRPSSVKSAEGIPTGWASPTLDPGASTREGQADNGLAQPARHLAQPTHPAWPTVVASASTRQQEGSKPLDYRRCSMAHDGTSVQFGGIVRAPPAGCSNVRDEEVTDTVADDRADDDNDDDIHGLEPHRQQRNPSAARLVPVAACAHGSDVWS